jgi:tripartite-type tricarboxylate transporter receptor subunit TctC
VDENPGGKKLNKRRPASAIIILALLFIADTAAAIKRRPARLIIILAAVCVAAASAALYFLRPVWLDGIFDAPVNLESVVVPFNPGSTADLTARALLREAAPGIAVHNIHGSAGARGINDVWNAPRDGTRILASGLFALEDAVRMGFSEHGPDEWEIWIVAYAPSVIAVSADSPYMTLADLLGVAEPVCADAGGGTLSRSAALLFAEHTGAQVRHESYAGTNPAIRAVTAGEADFVVALSSELIHGLRSGELRALAALSDEAVALGGAEIPPAAEAIPGLAALPPHGDRYGMMLPKDTPEKILRGYADLWRNAAAGEGFAAFAAENGLVRLAG